MRLDMGVFPVNKISFGATTRLDADVLAVDREELRQIVLGDPRVAGVELELVEPGESTRVIHVVDAIEPRLKVAGRGACYPGTFGPVDTVGQGTTHRLRGLAVVLSTEYPRDIETGVGATYETILDMSGPGALCPLSRTLNLVLVLTLSPGYSFADCHRAVQMAGLKVARRLAETTLEQNPTEWKRYELAPAPFGCPKVVYIHQMLTQLNLPVPYVTWYGLPITDWMPVWAHPNEILDGALLPSPRGGGATLPTSWEHVNNPVIARLYAEHGQNLDFRGVILHRTRFEVHEQKQLTANQAAKLAKLMGAEGAVVTWMGAGNAFIEGMLTVQALEREGIKAAFMTYEHGGSDGTEQPFIFSVPEADALVSVGSLDRPMTLPSVARVVGGADLVVNPEIAAERIPASGEISLDWPFPVASATDCWGFANRACVAY